MAIDPTIFAIPVIDFPSGPNSFPPGSLTPVTPSPAGTPGQTPGSSAPIPSNTSSQSQGSTTNPPAPKRRSAQLSIKSKLLKPAMTSHYECHITCTGDVKNWMQQRELPFTPELQDLLTLSCSEATLPGSSLLTSDINDHFTGVTERYAYRRQYDDTSDFTFYIDAPTNEGDKGYKTLWFFEQWMAYIVNEQYNGSPNINDNYYNYSVNFPDSYRSDIFITKFERDHDLSIPGKTGTKKYLQYRFIKAFPTSITSMPVSYDQSQLLKVTVSFTYLRYVVERKIGVSQGEATPYGFNGSTGSTPTLLPGYNTDFVSGYGKNPVGDFYPPGTLPAATTPAFNQPTSTIAAINN